MSKIKICEFTLRVFRFSLMWPNQSEEMNAGKWFYIRFIIFFLVIALWPASVLMHLINSLKRDMKKYSNTDLHINEDIGFISAFCGLYFMSALYVKNQPKMALLLQDLSNYKFGEPPGLEKKLQQLNFWSKIFTTYVSLGCVFYNLLKFMEKPACERNNLKKGLNENCGLLSPTWFPFRIDYFPAFQLAFLSVFLCTQALMKQTLMISYHALEIAHHIILRIDHLKIMIKATFDSDNKEERFLNCVFYHLEILDFAKRLQEIFYTSMLTHLTLTAAICGCIESQFVQGDGKIGALIHFFGWIFALFVGCTAGQDLINAASSLSEEIYNVNWYMAKAKLQKDLLFMYARSQKGLFIRAGGFGIMSFSLFVSVLKMSYSILAMITK